MARAWGLAARWGDVTMQLSDDAGSGSAANARIDVPKAEIAEFCRWNRFWRLALLGSVLRDDFGPDSDVDVLAGFEPGAVVGLFEICDKDCAA